MEDPPSLHIGLKAVPVEQVRHPVAVEVAREHVVPDASGMVDVGNGEQRMASEHGLYHAVVFILCPFSEIGVFLYALVGLLRAVSF